MSREADGLQPVDVFPSLVTGSMERSVGSQSMETTDSVCVINPRKSRREPGVDSPSLLVPVPGDLNRMNRLFQKVGRRIYQDPFLRVFSLPPSGKQIALAGPVIGAPQAVMLLEKLVALGSQKVILFGWCGGLQTTLSFGDILLPEWAYIEEGTSAHYAAGKRSRPSSLLFQALKERLEGEGLSFVTGAVWTTDAPYRETAAKVRAYQERGVWAVDMETAAVFTVGTFRKIRTAALLLVSDDLSRLRWRHGFNDPKFLEARKRVARFLFRLVLDAAQTP